MGLNYLIIRKYCKACATAAAAAVKEVTREGFSLASGVRPDVILSVVNSALSPMLSVNESVSRPVLFDGVPGRGDMARGRYTASCTWPGAAPQKRRAQAAAPTGNFWGRHADAPPHGVCI